MLLSLLLTVSCFAHPLAQQQSAQDRVDDLNDPELAPLIYRTEAFSGQPFGVGLLKYRMCADDGMIDRSGATLLTERNGRVFYPVFSRPASSRFFQKIIGGPENQPDAMHHVWFLFRGDQPLELTLHGACTTSKTVTVERTRDRKFDRSLRHWWREYNRTSTQQQLTSDYPPLIETWLRSMLSRRLSLPLPDDRERSSDPLMKTMELIFDMESLRADAIEDTMFETSDAGTADQPLPSGVFWDEAEIDVHQFDDVEIEDLARCIPEECYYLRFGSWENQIWLGRLMDEFGGDLGRMLSLRGYQSRIKSKFLNQLAIQSTEFDKLFGGKLISDVAVIGNDMFFEDGSAVGILLRAKNSKALKNNFDNKRKKFAKENAALGCVVDDVDVDGVRVQFLRTPDNRYRSFHVVRGDNHLVTSSISLARRFIQASAGTRSLADSAEFRYARREMPLSREDTVFVFVPSRLIQNLLGPHYQIELARRNRSITDMQIVQLAGLAATSEGFDPTDRDNLITHGFLPAGFGARPDGSQLSFEDGNWIDSIRGQRGFFVPIPDVELRSVTQQEIDWYAERRAYLSENLSQVDPMFVAIKRYQHTDNIERVVYDARVAPFGQDKYGWLFKMLGEPFTQRVVGSPDDVISFQASLSGDSISRRIPDHLVFGAIQNEEVPAQLSSASLLDSLDLIRTAPGYIGSFPAAGYLDWLPKLGGQPDPEGYTYSRMLGLWRLQWDPYSAIAFERQRLERLKGNVQLVDAQRPAQLLIEIGDLANSRLRDWANVQNFRRSWETSLANVKLLNMMAQQFNLDPVSARGTAETLLDVELVCSLGGDYQLLELSPQRSIWHSTAWPDFTTPELPADYVSPLLKWFRGLQLEVAISETHFSTHGYLDIERTGGSSNLPGFDLFKGFGNMLGGKQDASAGTEEK